MRLQHYLIIITIVSISFLIPFIMKSNTMAKSSHLNDEYSQYVISATEGAMASVADNNGAYVFSSESNRKKAVDTYYEILSKSFNYDMTTYEDLIKYYVPCIFLIDTDGYYVEYTAEYTDSDNVYCYQQLITPINKWAKSYSVGGAGITGNIYTVEYHLDDTIVVTYKDAHDRTRTEAGNYKDVYEKMGKPSELNVLSSYTRFDDEKTELIINTLQNQIEYYMNTYDGFLNQKMDSQYELTLTKIKGENWSRLVDSPTVFSFLQGCNTNYYNIYAFAGSEMEKDIDYYIKYDSYDGIYYYHTDKCPHVSAGDLSRAYTMYEAASKGAYPCPDCIR